MPKFVVQVVEGENRVVPDKRAIVDAVDAQRAAEMVLKSALATAGTPEQMRARVYPEFDLETSATRFFYALD